MKYVLFVLMSAIFLACNSAGTGGNLGHRVGGGDGEYFSDLPENSLSALNAVLNGKDGEDPLQFNPGFIYLEFDIQETADGELVLFHDDKLTRMLPNKGSNVEVYEELLLEEDIMERLGDDNPKVSDLRIRHLTLEQLQRLALEKTEDERVPTLDIFLLKALEWGIAKPMTSEIKRIVSDEGRLKFIELMASFRERLEQGQIILEPSYDMDPSGVSFLSFSGNFKKSYGDSKDERKLWCEKFDEYGFGSVYKARKHEDDLCDL